MPNIDPFAKHIDPTWQAIQRQQDALLPPQQSALTSAEHMNALQGELISDNLVAGWYQADRIRGQGQDTVYVFADADVPGDSVFAVFDGAGGSEDGKAAAEAARDFLHQNSMDNEGTPMVNPRSSLESLFEGLNTSVETKGNDGYATAIVGIIQTDRNTGERILHWGAVGDSLGYLFGTDGKLIPLNREETERQLMLDEGIDEAVADKRGNVILNAIGGGHYMGLRETGRNVLREGDQILLTSDGVTGDRASERLMGSEGDNSKVISKVLSQTDLSPKQKAKKLVDLATKNDDQTALIIEVSGITAAGTTGTDKTAEVSQPEIAALPEQELRVNSASMQKLNLLSERLAEVTANFGKTNIDMADDLIDDAIQKEKRVAKDAQQEGNEAGAAYEILVLGAGMGAAIDSDVKSDAMIEIIEAVDFTTEHRSNLEEFDRRIQSFRGRADNEHRFIDYLSSQVNGILQYADSEASMGKDPSKLVLATLGYALGASSERAFRHHVLREIENRFLNRS